MMFLTECQVRKSVLHFLLFKGSAMELYCYCYYLMLLLCLCITIRYINMNFQTQPLPCTSFVHVLKAFELFHSLQQANQVHDQVCIIFAESGFNS